MYVNTRKYTKYSTYSTCCDIKQLSLSLKPYYSNCFHKNMNLRTNQQPNYHPAYYVQNFFRRVDSNATTDSHIDTVNDQRLTASLLLASCNFRSGRIVIWKRCQHSDKLRINPTSDGLQLLRLQELQAPFSDAESRRDRLLAFPLITEFYDRTRYPPSQDHRLVTIINNAANILVRFRLISLLLT